MEGIMSRNEVIKGLKEIIIKTMELNVAPEDIKGENLIEEIGFNSVDALEILVWVENTFDMRFPDEDLSSELLTSLDNLADYVIRRKGQE
jgi:acyl carrier protein